MMIRKFSLFSQRAQDDSNPLFASSKVFSIEPHTQLLETSQRKLLLAKIKQLSRAPDQYYKLLYQPVLEKLSDYLQSLPDIRSGSSKDQIFWLDSALARTAYAMSLRHRISLPNDVSPAEAERDYALWTYVVFSSSLFWQIGKLSTHFLISICNAQGMVTRHWNPMVQSLFIAGDHYKIRNVDKNGPASFKQITTVLARNLMPNDGFTWVASNEKALQAWLLALVEEGGIQGSVTQVLDLSREIYDKNPSLDAFDLQFSHLEKEFDLFEKDLQEVHDIERAIRDGNELPPVTISEPPDTEIGEEFVKWLKKGVADRSIPFNEKDANVHISPDGVVLAYPELFQDFCTMFHRNKNWVVVYKQFNALGLHKKSGSDTWFGKFFIDTDKNSKASSASAVNSKSLRSFQGLLVEKQRALFNQSDAPKANSQLKLESSAAQQPQYPPLRQSQRSKTSPTSNKR